MNIVAKPYHALPCNLETFTINGIEAEVRDFGSSEDTDPYSAEPYGCGDHRFVRHETPKAGVLGKYRITIDEYNEVCSELESTLAVGSCGWCV